MKGEVLSIETTKRISELEKENERLKEELKSIKSNYKIQLEYDR